MQSSDQATPGSELSREFTVQNKMGIHARPAAMIVRVANKFNDVDVWVDKDDEQVNGRSIMGLMMLAAGQGAKLRFIATGPDAESLLAELEDLFSRKFEEA
ncbi:MAG: HPr family phosphocarrier protein [Verrucomicrobiota bacterium]